LSAAGYSLFEGVKWGRSQVLQQTLEKAAAQKASVALVERLQDVDRPADLPVWLGRRRFRPTSQKPMITVIIPALNEAALIGAAVASAAVCEGEEIIVVDGGSTDDTVEIARSMGTVVYETPPSKAGQMNTGAALACGDILIFLHADTRLPPGYAARVRRCIAQPGIAAGAFRLGIDAAGARLRFIERAANLRARFLQLPYGDQAIFMRADHFGAVGGFPDLAIMEDFELVRRLRRIGRIAQVPAAVLTSPRRWFHMGVLRSWMINQIVIIAYYLGISPKRLAGWYRRERGRGAGRRSNAAG
jgi:rSAM/selenodomain-associated transferase 2